MTEGLVWSDALVVEAAAIRVAVARTLADRDVPGELALTGAASLPGALTKGDVDLHLRVVGPDAFAAALERLAEVYRPTSRAAWAATLAVFDVPGGRPTGLAVTPVDSEHDRRFRRSWSRLRDEPALLEEYNAWKRAAFGDPSYEGQKSAFFTRIAEE
jgi:GrpB-like predicted nucleotidyltransferase (UPF0157 family)